jgi:hypothetical protein
LIEVLIEVQISMPRVENRIKCKYCSYQCARFIGKRYGGRKLFFHVLENHEKEFLKSIGFAGTLEQYLNTLDAQEEYLHA